MSQARFLLDEHVWGGLIEVGRQFDADLVLVQTRLAKGASDEEVLTYAASQGRVLLTSNAQDFAPLAAAWFLGGRDHWGIIVVPGQTDRSLLSRALLYLRHFHPGVDLKNSFRFVQEFV